MKIVLYIIGIFMALFGAVKIVLYVFWVPSLTAYGKGNLLGNVFLLIIGATIIFFVQKKRKAGNIKN